MFPTISRRPFPVGVSWVEGVCKQIYSKLEIHSTLQNLAELMSIDIPHDVAEKMRKPDPKDSVEVILT